MERMVSKSAHSDFSDSDRREEKKREDIGLWRRNKLKEGEKNRNQSEALDG